jgi:hypothetical protein
MLRKTTPDNSITVGLKTSTEGYISVPAGTLKKIYAQIRKVKKYLFILGGYYT